MIIRKDIQDAVEALLSGGVICYPTEGVYGLGCIPYEAEAVYRILNFKQRSVANGVILIGATPEHLLPWIAPTPAEIDNLLSETQQPTTWVVRASPIAPDWITGGRDTVAVRFCTHPVAQQLCIKADSALVSTSANRSGKPPTASPVAARYRMQNFADAIVGGATLSNCGPSAIRLGHDGTIIRPA